MEIAIIVGVLGIAALFVLFFVARRMLRVAIRLALACLLVLILVAGGLFWWWTNADKSPTENTNRTAQPARRTSSK